jgi:hypothetical protein
MSTQSRYSLPPAKKLIGIISISYCDASSRVRQAILSVTMAIFFVSVSPGRYC